MTDRAGTDRAGTDKALSRHFARGDHRKATWNSHTIYSYLRFSINPGDTLRLTRRRSSPTRAQALKLQLDKGELRANGVLMETAAIWTHSAPSEVTLEVVGRRAKSIDIWNAWSLSGVESSWLGNSAMRVTSEGATHIISCSDGVGDVNFDDLVIQLDLASG